MADARVCSGIASRQQLQRQPVGRTILTVEQAHLLVLAREYQPPQF
jgi:hypothetical protein